MKSKTSYTFISQLNFLRFFAAVAIVIFHFGQWSYPFTSALVKPFVLISNLGVTLFFVLSGFIMVHVYSDKLGKKIDKKLVTSFYKARVARIAPIYFVSLLGVLLFNFYKKGLFSSASLVLKATQIKTLLMSRLLLSDISVWLIPVELFIYGTILFFVCTFVKKNIKKQVGLFIGIGLFLIVLAYSLYNKKLLDISSLLLQLSFLHAWVPGQALKLNFTGWSLSVEMFFYALFPFLIVYFAKKDIKQQLTITSLIWLISTAITTFIFFRYTPTEALANNFMKFLPLLHVNSFIIGMMAGYWYKRVNVNIKIWSGVALLLLFLNPIFIDNSYNPLQHNGLLAPLFAVVIIGIAQTKNSVQKILSITPFVIGGDISYGIYILQVPVYRWVYEMYTYLQISTLLGEAGRFFVYLIILIIVSYISKHTIEKWGRSRILKIKI